MIAIVPSITPQSEGSVSITDAITGGVGVVKVII